MAKSSHSLQPRQSEGISQSGNDFTDREVISQLQEAIRIVITLSGLPKGEIAEALEVAPSTISAWLDRTGINTRKLEPEEARAILKLVKPQPRKILEAFEVAENLLERLNGHASRGGYV